MRWRLVVMTLIGLLVTACARTPIPQVSNDDHLTQLYVNKALGFRLLLPGYWTLAVDRQDFTVALQLRPDQEPVLQAYDAGSKLGLVIVIQQGPVAEIEAFMQRLQAVSTERLDDHLMRLPETDFRQLALRRKVVNGYEAAEWIYTVTDTSEGVPIDTAVSVFVLNVREHYVYLTFSTPTAQYATAKPIIESVVQTFKPSGEARK
jgi:hypothetical protein